MTGAPAVRPGVLRLIGHPFSTLGFLAGGEGLPLAPDAGLLVVLSLLELRQEPGLLALLLEPLERALEGLVGLYDDLGHSAPPSRHPHRININYISCAPPPSNRAAAATLGGLTIPSGETPGRDDRRPLARLHRRPVRRHPSRYRRPSPRRAALVGVEPQQAPGLDRARAAGARPVSRPRAVGPRPHGGGVRLVHRPPRRPLRDLRRDPHARRPPRDAAGELHVPRDRLRARVFHRYDRRLDAPGPRTPADQSRAHARQAHGHLLHLPRLEHRWHADAARRSAALPRLPAGRALRLDLSALAALAPDGRRAARDVLRVGHAPLHARAPAAPGWRARRARAVAVLLGDRRALVLSRQRPDLPDVPRAGSGPGPGARGGGRSPHDPGGDQRGRGRDGRQLVHRQRAQLYGEVDRRGAGREDAELLRVHALQRRGAPAALRRGDADLLSLAPRDRAGYPRRASTRSAASATAASITGSSSCSNPVSTRSTTTSFRSGG